MFKPLYCFFFLAFNNVYPFIHAQIWQLSYPHVYSFKDMYSTHYKLCYVIIMEITTFLDKTETNVIVFFLLFL